MWSTGGGFELSGGFWQSIQPTCASYAPADFDEDCDLDLADFVAFAACATGANVPYAEGCSRKELDADADVDQGDFAVLQRCWSGSLQADPACAN